MCVNLKRLGLCLLVLLSMSACQEEVISDEEAELSFGLPGKGDQSCKADSLLCWVGGDPDLARHLMDVESSVLLGEQEPIALATAVKALAFKMNDEERLALGDFEAKLANVGQGDEALEQRAELVKEGFNTVYGRVISGYWAAHSTVLSEAIQNTDLDRIMEQGLNPELDGKQDGESSAQTPEALSSVVSVKPALDQLWSQGPFGQYLVTMLTLTGTHKYEPSARSMLEREAGLDLPIDDEAKRIVNHHSRLAAMDSFFGGMSSLIPIAGAYISVSYGVYAQFKVRAKMALELGTLYGLDSKNPDDFLVIMQGMVAAQGFKELFSSFYKALFGQQGYRMIAGRGGNRFLNGADDFSEHRVGELVKLSLGQMTIYGVRILELIKARIAGSAGRSLLGQISFGVLTLAEVTIDYLVINTMGRELRYAFHPWGWATYLEAMPQLADAEFRRCAHSALIEVARADNNVSEFEAWLMQEALIRPFHAEDTPDGATVIRPNSRREGTAWTAFIEQDLILNQLNEAELTDPYYCLGYTWAEEDSFGQLSLLAWLELMAHSDGSLLQSEEEVLTAFSDLFPVKTEEQRVYASMVDRVASHPQADETASSAFWMWDVTEWEDLERSTSNETRRLIWQKMR